MRELEGVLREEARELDGLLVLLGEETAAIRRADPGALADIVRAQGAVVERLRQHEGVRAALAARAAQDLGVTPPTLTLGRLLELTPTPGLRGVADELRRLRDAVTAATRRNAILAERALRHTTRILTAIAAEPAPTYAESGRPGPASPALGLLDRAV